MFPEADSFAEVFTAIFENYKLNINGQECNGDFGLLKEVALEHFGNCEYPMVSGVEKLIKHMYENNIPMAIATNGEKTSFELILNGCRGWNDKYFSHILCGGSDPDVKANKPAPDVYLVCAERFDPKPKSMNSCVIFEDSIRGITGALSTGMKTVLINEKAPKGIEEIADKITVIVDSFDNFKPEYVGLPPY